MSLGAKATRVRTDETRLEKGRCPLPLIENPHFTTRQTLQNRPTVMHRGLWAPRHAKLARSMEPLPENVTTCNIRLRAYKSVQMGVHLDTVEVGSDFCLLSEH